MKTDWSTALTVSCPTCYMREGERCVRKRSGQDAQEPHKQRIAKAKREGLPSFKDAVQDMVHSKLRDGGLLLPRKVGTYSEGLRMGAMEVLSHLQQLIDRDNKRVVEEYDKNVKTGASKLEIEDDPLAPKESDEWGSVE